MNNKKSGEQRHVWAYLFSFIIIGTSLILSIMHNPETGAISINISLLFLGVLVAIFVYIALTYRGKFFLRMRYCVNCGRSIPFDANVCPYCGHDYPENAPIQ